MTSHNTTEDNKVREGQDHAAEEIPSLGEIRFHRLMRLLFGLAVWPVGAFGLSRIIESGGDPFEVVATILAIATTALGCSYAGLRATQLQTERDEPAPLGTNLEGRTS